MNFEFSAEEQAFLKEVDEFLCKNYSPEVMDPARENFAQLVDTPARRAFMPNYRASVASAVAFPRLCPKWQGAK